jgi:lipopolysaccharide cholinephosphotransferase
MKEISLSECHDILLSLAKEFHTICTENDIPYYMLGGTQLGAVRHKGFIPWDDDMDFGVPREYFSSMVDALKRELPPSMRVLDIHNSDLYTEVLKIEMLGTRIEEQGRTDKGINVDVFPLDYTNLKKGYFSANFLTYLAVKYNYFAYTPLVCHGAVRASLQYMLTKFRPVRKATFLRWIAEKSLKNRNNFTAYANHYGFWNLKEIHPKEVFGNPVLYDFEGINLYGVEDYDKYLSSLYGNYMELPPESKRHIHCSKIWIESSVSNVRQHIRKKSMEVFGAKKGGEGYDSWKMK